MNKKIKIWKRLIYKSGDLFVTRRSETLRRARGETFQSTRTYNPYLPSRAYNAIKANNPQGSTVYKRK